MKAFTRHPDRVRLVAAFLAVIYVVVSIGFVPTPWVLAQWCGGVLTGLERYPCEDHACGCASAAECWAHCCCHTPRQRLAWAIRHGVRPPVGVSFSEEDWIAAANDVRAGSAECSVCVEGIKSKLDQGIRTEGPATEAGAGCEAQRPAAGLSMSALACKGIKQVLAMSLPPFSPMRAEERLAPPARVDAGAIAKESRPASRTLEALEPPPRRA
ncbi:MAG: hypothetical protein U0573_02335 [Phycisphaerales bacterium]|nr:hypothetical protein [Planctomycetota bacterium]